ncbi:MAG: Gfo/Idh/MocA family oxidoreductase [bacterium]|nr:Gfo/Idh/MocA family oxidoreductase [bacterium]
MSALRALILGSGFAGQGHAMALRDSGVDIVGMASRTRTVVEQIAGKLKIPYATTNWQQALVDLKPDLVAVGTPGGAHLAPALAALSQGCHVLCDKPLATSARDAKALYLKSREKDVKTAYAASFRYQPHALLAKELVAEGVLGEPQETECISHYNLDPLIPFGWSHRIDQGGGRLANNFTHKLSIILHVLDGRITAVNGETRNDMHRAPVVEGVHDFRERDRFAPKNGADPDIEWASVDSEWTYTVLARISSTHPHRMPVSAVFKHSGLQPRFAPDGVAFYGSEGAIHIEGAYAQGPLYLTRDKKTWEQIPVPEHITRSLPDIVDDTQRNWTQLAREWVAHIQGGPYSGYQTFADGWRYQEVVDAIRRGQGWETQDQDIL